MLFCQLDPWLPVIWTTPFFWGLQVGDLEVVVFRKAVRMARNWFKVSCYGWSSHSQQVHYSYLFLTGQLKKLPVVLPLLILLIHKFLNLTEVTVAWNSLSLLLRCDTEPSTKCCYLDEMGQSSHSSSKGILSPLLQELSSSESRQRGWRWVAIEVAFENNGYNWKLQNYNWNRLTFLKKDLQF